MAIFSSKVSVCVCLAAIIVCTTVPTSAWLAVLDSLFWLVSYLDGVEQANSETPNYVDGNWRPVHNTLHNVEVKVEGTIPDDLLHGMYVRNGPNMRCWPPANKHHAFNGEAMLHLVSLSSALTVSYTNSWVEQKHQDAEPGGKCGPSFSFGDLNGGGLAFLRLLILGLKMKIVGIQRPPQERTQAGSTALVFHGNKLLASTETFLPFEVELTHDSVKPVGFYDFNGMLTNQKVGPKDGTFSAHPTIDNTTGAMYFFSANGGLGSLPFVAFGSVFANGTTDRYFHIPTPSPQAAFYHDILLTENYAIFVDTSLRKDLSRFAKFQRMIFFNSTYNMRFGVLPRAATGPDELLWVECSSPGHVWHTVSAHEKDGQIVVFAPKFDVYTDDIRIHLSDEDPSYLTKFVLDLKTLKAREENIFNQIVERPSTNLKFLSPTVVYLRSEGLTSREMGREIVKFDLLNEKILGKFGCLDECIFGEALFVPRLNSLQEDDGYLIDIVYFPSNDTSAFMIWDALTMSNQPIAAAYLPQRVPFGVHGLWLEEDYFKIGM